MFGRFFYGQCSLSEAFWKFSVLGLTAAGFLARILMTLLKQTVNYDPSFLRVLVNNLSFLHMNTSALPLLCFYIAAFLALIVYAVVCIIGMWNTYKEYEKSKILALICMLAVIGISYFYITKAIY